jgi:hypothetical protein
MVKPKYICNICLDTGKIKCPVCKGTGLNPEKAETLIFGPKCRYCKNGFTNEKCNHSVIIGGHKRKKAK